MDRALWPNSGGCWLGRASATPRAKKPDPEPDHKRRNGSTWSDIALADG